MTVRIAKGKDSMEQQLALNTQERLHQVWRTNVVGILLNHLRGLCGVEKGGRGHNRIEVRVVDDVLLLRDAVVTQRRDGIRQGKPVIEDAKPTPKYEFLLKPLRSPCNGNAGREIAVPLDIVLHLIPESQIEGEVGPHLPGVSNEESEIYLPEPLSERI